MSLTGKKRSSEETLVISSYKYC